jgi:hypothetical protein
MSLYYNFEFRIRISNSKLKKMNKNNVKADKIVERGGGRMMCDVNGSF